MHTELYILSDCLDHLIVDGYDIDRILIFINTYLDFRRDEFK